MASDTSHALSGNGARVTGDDAGLFEHVARHLSTALLSDALDELGVRDRVMREHLRPLDPNTVMTGWARTILCMDLYHIPDDPYAKEIAAIDSILPGEVVVAGTAESKRNAPWGELLSTAAKARGARGAVIDGLIRDTKRILAMGFPVFAAGFKPVDSKGRGAVVDYNVPVECGGVLVQPGDLIAGDCDGVVAIPAPLVEEVVQRATDKAHREDKTRADLSAGGYLRDAFAKYGVL